MKISLTLKIERKPKPEPEREFEPVPEGNNFSQAEIAGEHSEPELKIGFARQDIEFH